jgi:prepilin-type N-terminal cleavage/methylation domain-containing protein
MNTHTLPRRLHRQSGFTLLEVAIAVVLILLVGTTAIASLRSGLRTLTGAEQSSIAVSSVREFREFTFRHTMEELDQLQGQILSPVLGNGDPMPGAHSLLLKITVEARQDSDPTLVVLPEESRTRHLTVLVMNQSQQLLEASWLATEH